MKARATGLVLLAGLSGLGAASPAPQYSGQRGYDTDRYGDTTIRCESNDGRSKRCDLPRGGGEVRLVRQLSDTACVDGRTWGQTGDFVWVSGGCRAEFAVRGGGYGNGNGGGNDRTFRCESGDGRYRQCAAEGRGRIRLVRQLSNAPCVEGRTWGSERGGVWVDRGCRAEFASGGGWGGGNWNGGRPDDGYGQTIRCESSDERTRRCDVNVRRDVRLVRQLSNTRCVQGENWGWDPRGIWVSRGCRAEFSVR